MPVSGLVLSIQDEPGSFDRVLAAIAQDSRITVGARESNKLAIVIDTPSSQEDQSLWQWLQSLAGVSFIEVAFVGFDDRKSVEQIGPSGSGAAADQFHSTSKGNTHDGL